MALVVDYEDDNMSYVFNFRTERLQGLEPLSGDVGTCVCIIVGMF